MRRFHFVFCVVILFVSSSFGAYAQTPAAAPAAGTSTTVAIDETTLVLPEAAGTGGGGASPSIMPYFLRMVFVLGLVLAAIYGLYALLKRSARPVAPVDTYLRVLASTTIASGRSLHVVSVGNAAWLVGATESSIGLISELKDKEIIDALTLRAVESPETPRKDFNTMLGELLGRKQGRTHTSSYSSDFLNRQKDRLKKF